MTFHAQSFFSWGVGLFFPYPSHLAKLLWHNCVFHSTSSKNPSHGIFNCQKIFLRKKKNNLTISNSTLTKSSCLLNNLWTKSFGRNQGALMNFCFETNPHVTFILRILSNEIIIIFELKFYKQVIYIKNLYFKKLFLILIKII